MAEYREGQRLRGSDGNVYVVQNGVPVMEQAAVLGGIVTKGADPTRPAQIRSANANANKATTDATVAGATTQAAIDKANADARKAEAEARIAELTAAQGNTGKGVSPEVREKALAAFKAAQAIDRLVSGVENRFDEGPGKTKGLMGLKDYLPSEANDRFNNAGNALRGYVGTALGFTGGQLNTATESAQSVGPFLPTAGDRDAVILDKIERLKAMASEARERSISILGGVPDVNGKITPIGRGVNLGAVGANIDTATPTVANEGRYSTDADKAFNDRVYAAYRSGASFDDLNGLSVSEGRGPLRDPEGWQKAVESRNQGRPLAKPKPPESGEVGAAQRGAASAPGAFVRGVSNAIIPGGLISPELNQQNQLVAQAQPEATLAGSIIGGIPLMAGAELGALRLLPAAPLAATRAADTAYGAYQGFGNAEEGQGLEGAVIGGATSALGSEVGRRVASGAGRAIRGISSPAVRYLSNEGVNLTGGQAIGGVAKQMEDQLTGFPVIGGVVGARRQEGLTDFNRAMFRQGAEGAPIQNIGERGAEELDRLVTQTYAPLDNVMLNADGPLMSDLAAAAQRGQSIPGRADDFNYVVNTRVGQNFDPNGAMPGRNYQDAVRGVRQAGGNQGVAAMHPGDFSDALGDVEGALTGMVYRQAPEAVDALESGNRIYRNQAIIDEAVKAARNVRGPDGDALVMPSQLNTAATSNTNHFGGRSRAATTERPFYDLATNGQEVLPSRIGDSGTAGRLALGTLGLGAVGGGGTLGYGGEDGSIAGAAGGAGVGGLSLIAALALGGSQPAQRALTRALIERPEWARQAGGAIVDNSRIGGWIGGPTALNLLGQN